MTAQPQSGITEEQYLDGERASAVKHEYFAGRIYAMTGASEQHNLIATNIAASLHAQLRQRLCRLYPSDMPLKVEQTGLYTYPDLSVVCGAPQFTGPGNRDTLINPTLLIEILSPSTERYDRGLKAQHYRTIAALQEYLLVAQDRPHIERYLRQGDGSWALRESAGLAAALDLPSLGCRLALADVYEQVEWPAAGLAPLHGLAE